jgi:hypothetical protein
LGWVGFAGHPDLQVDAALSAFLKCSRMIQARQNHSLANRPPVHASDGATIRYDQLALATFAPTQPRPCRTAIDGLRRGLSVNTRIWAKGQILLLNFNGQHHELHCIAMQAGAAVRGRSAIYCLPW